MGTALPFALAGAEVAVGDVAGVTSVAEVPEAAGDTVEGAGGG